MRPRVGTHHVAVLWRAASAPAIQRKAAAANPERRDGGKAAGAIAVCIARDCASRCNGVLRGT